MSSPQHVDGLLMGSDSGNDPRYYEKKKKKEAELGRPLTTAEFQADHYAGPDSYASGTSIFDPVLCELIYRWFSPVGGLVLDPFAGGSVRGVVASVLGREYVGVDLSERQVAANRRQAEAICQGSQPRWIVGDSAGLDALDVPEADLVFSCPPYFDLEVYGDDPADISAMAWPAFLEAYRRIIALAVGRLRADRFACFVVGEVRGPDGVYRNLVGETIRAFQDAGASYYNEIILVTSVGSLPIRAGRIFEASRKLGKTHQNVLVFCKGDPKRATAACGPVQVGDLPADAPAPDDGPRGSL